MEKRDARQLNTEAQYELRRTAIQLLKSGKTQKEVAEILDIGTHAVWRWNKLYKAKGVAGLQLKQRGRCQGAKRRLTPEQEKEIQRIIRDKYPEQLKLTFALWNR